MGTWECACTPNSSGMLYWFVTSNWCFVAGSNSGSVCKLYLSFPGTATAVPAARTCSLVAWSTTIWCHIRLPVGVATMTTNMSTAVTSAPDALWLDRSTSCLTRSMWITDKPTPRRPAATTSTFNCKRQKRTLNWPVLQRCCEV